MPMRLNKLVKILAQYEISVAPGSRHYKATREGARCYTIPAHNGMKSEIDDKYLKACAKHFGIPIEELLKKQ